MLPAPPQGLPSGDAAAGPVQNPPVPGLPAPSLPVRVIPRLDIKSPNVIKTIHLEGLRIVGKPADLARKYYQGGADEVLYMDAVASLYGRNSILEIVTQAAREVFVPLTVGGGIRSVEDMKQALRNGAEKVAINTAATRDPDLLRRGAEAFGSQCIVLSVDAKRIDAGRWEVLVDNGREKTGRDLLEWVEEAASLGAGEVLVTSIDREGTRKGFDIDLIRRVRERVSIPVIAGGGAGSAADVAAMIDATGIDAACCAGLFHYGLDSIAGVKAAVQAAGRDVRLC